MGLCLLLNACGSDEDPAEAAPEPEVFRVAVLPSATDPAINLIYSTAFDSHQVYIPRNGPTVGRLFVFFPGSGAQPRSYQLILREAARRGYHAVGITYENTFLVSDLCNAGGNSDLDCAGEVRSEILTGVDSTTLVNVNVANSVDNRLLKLLQWLNGQFPQDNWSQFYPGGAVDWTRISAAGHSQGGGLSAYVGKRRNLFRITLYSQGGDVSIAGLATANWVRRPSVTPTGAYYGFTSGNDELANWLSVLGVNANWTTLGMGMTGDTTNVDLLGAPYANLARRKLVTRAQPRNPALVVGPNHNVTVVDVNTPLDADGQPLFAPIWRYCSLP